MSGLLHGANQVDHRKASSVLKIISWKAAKTFRENGQNKRVLSRNGQMVRVGRVRRVKRRRPRPRSHWPIPEILAGGRLQGRQRVDRLAGVAAQANLRLPIVRRGA